MEFKKNSYKNRRINSLNRYHWMSVHEWAFWDIKQKLFSSLFHDKLRHHNNSLCFKNCNYKRWTETLLFVLLFHAQSTRRWSNKFKLFFLLSSPCAPRQKKKLRWLINLVWKIFCFIFPFHSFHGDAFSSKKKQRTKNAIGNEQSLFDVLFSLGPRNKSTRNTNT